MAAIGAAHLPRLHVRVPALHVLAALEAEAEQPVRRVERGLDDVMKLEVRLDRRLIDIATPLAQLLAVVAPVPRRGGEIPAPPLPQRLQGIAVGERARTRRHPAAV